MNLPLPAAVVAHRARNAKSPKERHDTAWYAREASLRLAVAARGPADPAACASLFEQALADESIRADLAGDHLYNGACAAALASAVAAGADAAAWRAKSLAGLRESVARRRASVASLAAARAPETEKERRRLAAALARIRSEDDDLTALRGSPELEAILQAGEPP